MKINRLFVFQVENTPFDFLFLTFVLSCVRDCSEKPASDRGGVARTCNGKPARCAFAQVEVNGNAPFTLSVF